jgi:hypothetical protein
VCICDLLRHGETHLAGIADLKFQKRASALSCCLAKATATYPAAAVYGLRREYMCLGMETNRQRNEWLTS